VTVAPGRLIALEGIDGCGKTTQARLLAQWLGALCTFEPGATSLGASLRALVLDPDRAPVDPRAEALLLAADRAQHVAEVVAPTLSAGRWVVTDRYVASTVAYQGFGRGLDRDGLDRLAEWATGGLRPDLTVLLDLPVAVATSRRAGSRDDRFEAEGEVFLQRVADGFRALAAEGRDPWLVVDATDPADVVAATVRQAVGALPGTPAVSET
jgi:dTMP kinase